MTPTTAIEVGGTRARISITAVVDTGFDGQFCLPMHLAVRLGLELMGAELVEFADGSKKQELYFRGWVRFLGERRRAKFS